MIPSMTFGAVLANKAWQPCAAPSPTGYVYRVTHRHDIGFRGEYWNGFTWTPITGPEPTRKSAEYGCIAHAGRNGITADKQGLGYFVAAGLTTLGYDAGNRSPHAVGPS